MRTSEATINRHSFYHFSTLNRGSYYNQDITFQSWQQTMNDKIKIILRDVPLSQVRVASVFADKTSNEEANADDGVLDPLEKDRDVSHLWPLVL